jgi:hypothetical protein
MGYVVDSCRVFGRNHGMMETRRILSRRRRVGSSSLYSTSCLDLRAGANVRVGCTTTCARPRAGPHLLSAGSTCAHPFLDRGRGWSGRSSAQAVVEVRLYNCILYTTDSEADSEAE